MATNLTTPTINAQTADRATTGNITSMAQSQWFRRPADHKFASLDALLNAVRSRRSRSAEFVGDVRSIQWAVDPLPVTQDIQMHVTLGPRRPMLTLQPSHYSFSQACSLVGAPAGYFRDKLADRPDLVVQALNHGFTKRDAESVKLMTVDPRVSGPTRLQAVTSESYGRIWDADVVEAAKVIIDRTEGRFDAPHDWGKEKRSLFASDRDVFMFFCDGGSIVDGGGERDQLHRGFFMWNSEVGTQTFGIACFLFRAVCGNFGIWGAQDVRMLKIRHTSGGPARFINEAVPALREYLAMSAKPVETAVRKAKTLMLPTAQDALDEFFMKHPAAKFTRPEIRRAVDTATAEEGQCATLWDAYNGFTAVARTMAFAEAKVDLEKRAGKLMEALV